MEILFWENSSRLISKNKDLKKKLNCCPVFIDSKHWIVLSSTYRSFKFAFLMDFSISSYLNCNPFNEISLWRHHSATHGNFCATVNRVSFSIGWYLWKIFCDFFLKSSDRLSHISNTSVLIKKYPKFLKYIIYIYNKFLACISLDWFFFFWPLFCTD